ncbi:MAG TPA: response regulator [Polyangiaceae bacterium]|nr:response regulator [Polyangiaceae bacterium]
MKRVLFVDDEPALLAGLRDRLRKHRREWDMVFALGGEAALAECARGAFDVVVSDMRMPEMDGATLLGRIQKEYPSTVRIVLSGHAERAAVMRALPVAHQYLSKPCDVETLRSVISRACALRDLMNDAALRSVVGRVDRLPSVSAIYTDLTTVLARDAASIDDVVRVVERDPAMCLKLLQIVNSAFFGLPRRVSAMREAISYLGIELLKSLVLAAQIFSSAEGAGGPDAGWLSAVQRHSMKVGRVTRAIAAQDREDAFMAGMLHDVGMILLALTDRARVSDIVESARSGGVPCHVAERERLGVTHAEVGAYILGTWGVPFVIAEAVAGHHEPANLGGSCFDLATALHVAECLVTEHDERAGDRLAPLDLEHLEKVGALGLVPAWREQVRRLNEEPEN